MTRGLALLLLSALAAGIAAAQTPRTGLPPLRPVPQAAPPQQGEAEAGRRLAAGRAGPDGIACHLCHGLDGQADGSGAFPHLGGQAAWYLYRQLRDYADGARPHAVMGPIAADLTEADMRDLAAWYAAQPAPRTAAPEAEAQRLQLGGAIAAAGIAARGVTACVQCHGARGEGRGPDVPALAGQHAAYTALQLRLWRQGQRRNDALGVMAQVAAGLSDSEMDAVALYYARLPAPGP